MTRAVGGAWRFIAPLLPAAAGRSFGPGIYQGMGGGKHFFHPSVPAMLTLQGIAAGSYPLPDLTDPATLEAPILIDGHSWISSRPSSFKNVLPPGLSLCYFRIMVVPQVGHFT